MLQRKYNRILRIVRDLTPDDFYTLITSLEDGYHAYRFLDHKEKKDDIDSIEEALND